MPITTTLTWLGFFTAIILSYYFYLSYRNKERMALIEKGVDVSEVYKRREISFNFPWLRLGMLTLGIGLGIFFAYLYTVLISQRFPGHNHEFGEMILTWAILIFGGLGIIVGNILEKSGNKKNG